MRDEIAQKDRFMRDNLDAMAQKVGEMQAKLVGLEAMGERISGRAGMKAEDLKPLQRGGGVGVAAWRAARVARMCRRRRPSLEQLQSLVSGLGKATAINTDLYTDVESRLQESRLTALLVPSAPPVAGPLGSGFGFRSDPLNGRPALHTGLDFPAETGTAITAAAGAIVVTNEWHPGCGQVLEIDHGNGLVTDYAHCSSIEVGLGALVKRGQLVAKVGHSGRSTGSHLHFEGLVHGGVPQDPARFLAASATPRIEFAARPSRR